jgi:hypothetical protein
MLGASSGVLVGLCHQTTCPLSFPRWIAAGELKLALWQPLVMNEEETRRGWRIGSVQKGNIESCMGEAGQKLGAGPGGLVGTILSRAFFRCFRYKL